MKTPELTDNERAVLREECWASFAKADAMLHAACDVSGELHIQSGFVDHEDDVQRALLYVFIERCMRRGLNPGEEIESWLADMGLPTPAQMKDDAWWQQNGAALVKKFMADCAELRTEAPVWGRTKNRALRVLTVVAVGTPEERRAYDCAVLGDNFPKQLDT